MADTTKAQKLAVARKKFKELKKEKQKNLPQAIDAPPSIVTSRESTPIEPPYAETAQTDQLNNYFNNGNDSERGLQQPAAFFDTFTDSAISPEQNYFNTLATQSLLETANYFNAEPPHAAETPPNPAPIEPASDPQPIVAGLQHFLHTEPSPSFAELVAEQHKSQQLSQALQAAQARAERLAAQIGEKEQLYLQAGAATELEVARLREELRCHLQAVQIHVTEKAELLATVGELQALLKQRGEACEELQGRLKTSRSRGADLERELNICRQGRAQAAEDGAELEKYRREIESVRGERDELQQDALEAGEKLKNGAATHRELQQQVDQLTNQLGMAAIKIQQLTVGDGFEQWAEEKAGLERQIGGLNETIGALTADRDEASLQYQQYAQQLNTQIANLAERVEQLEGENRTLAGQEQSRIRHIGELEKQLQSAESNQLPKRHDSSKVELENALDLIETLQKSVQELQEVNRGVLSDKDDILRELAARSETVQRLEEIVEKLQEDRPDNVKLLAAIESDKVAASRAVLQNGELKQQMESMQEVFVKLNNDKVDLTEKLSIEQASTRTLFEKLQKTEIHLQTLATAIEVKDKELSHLRETTVDLSKQILQSEQLADRLRHYEAGEHGSRSLQTELQEAQLAIVGLKDELDRARAAQTERELLAELRPPPAAPADAARLDHETAMRRLEAKFLRTIKEVADLTEEKQRLEHLVLQLQNETETIGEYVALYQRQRSVLKQKAVEKDQQLTQLASDRATIRGKIDRLNALIGRLVAEKGAVPSELLAQHALGEAGRERDLCEEHARMHSEINKLSGMDGGDRGSETAERIIELLAEIKTSNLVQPMESLHHCPWCSGQLITV